MQWRTTSWATDWEHGLISGDGRQGAVLWGEPSDVRITISHERLFAPVTPPIDAPDTAAILPELRELILAGNRQQAADRVVELAQRQGFDGTHGIDPFIGAATLTWRPVRPVESDRGVDLRTGVIHGHGVRCFVSRAHRVIVIELPGPGELTLDPIDGEPPCPITFHRPNPLTLRADFPDAWPGAITGYTTTMRVTAAEPPATPGRVVVGDEGLLLVLRTTVDPGAPLGEPVKDELLLDDLPANWDDLLTAHVAAQAPLVDACTLRLPDDARIERLFAAGRYAIISSSGELPPTLQGVWSGTYQPAWASGFTMDGNLATALAAAAPTGTPQLLLTIFNLIDSVRGQLADNARQLYGARGLLVPPHVSTHGRHNHFGPTWCLTFWTAGAGWLAKLAMEHWRHTGDLSFLRERAWPLLVDAAEFYQDFVLDGVLVPSYSPENSPAGSTSQAAVNATMDIAVIRALGRDLAEAAQVLGEQAPQLPPVPPYQVHSGELAEWIWPGLAPNPEHRHASHLFGLWYDPDPQLLADKELCDAAATTIERRLDWWEGNGDEMAFGLVQLGLAAATLGRTALAERCLGQLGRYWRDNLVSTHNLDHIFNTDICGGLPALVVAMLMRSCGDQLELLPAVPARWRTGEVTGLLARGPVQIIRLAWTPELVEVSLSSSKARSLIVSHGGSQQVVELIAGVAQTLALPRC